MTNHENLEYIKRGFDYWFRNDFEKALVYYEKALEINSNDIVTLLDRAQCLQILRKYEESLEVFEDVIKLDLDVYPTYEKKLNELDNELQIPGWRSLHLPVMRKIDLQSVLVGKIISLEALKKEKEVKECKNRIFEWHKSKLNSKNPTF